MRTLNALKKLAVKLGCAASTANVTGKTTDEVLEFINTNYKMPALPTTAGNYKLVVTVSEGVATYSWEAIV